MQIGEYLKKNDISQKFFAGMIRVSESTLSRILSGERQPSLSVMSRIHKVTKGKVSPNDFIVTEVASTLSNTGTEG